MRIRLPRAGIAADGPRTGAASAEERKRGQRPVRRTFLFAFVLVIGGLGIGAAVELVLRYRENVDAVFVLQSEIAENAAFKIRKFIDDIEKSMRASAFSAEAVATGLSDSFRFELLALLKTTPAITSAVAIDHSGQEIAKVSREALVDPAELSDQSASIPFMRTRTGQPYFGRLYFVRGSEPYMRIGAPIEWFEGEIAGVLVAEVSLRYIRDVISDIKVGNRGYAYVVSHEGDLIAHPDMSLVLQRSNVSDLGQVAAAIAASPISFQVHRSIVGEQIFAAHAPIRDLGWSVIVEQPVAEAFAPVLASVLRTAVFAVVALATAFLISLLISRKVIRPLNSLREGAARFGAGELDHRVDIDSQDEFEDVADEFNEMAARLHDLRASLEQRVEDRTRELKDALDGLKALNRRVQSQSEELAEWNRTLEARVAEKVEQVERMSKLRRFLSPQVADAILRGGDDQVLKSHRSEITVVFCDLRGFTAFSRRAEPEDVMQLLADYYEALGGLINKYEGTLERFVGDGLMVFFNDPVPCPNPAERAVHMAVEMRKLVAEILDGWTKGGFDLGFGVGIAQGFATLGRIGFEGRYDYASIGSVTNLGSRLCDEAEAGQIIISQRLVPQVEPFAVIEPLDTRSLKGFRNPVALHNVERLKDS